ISNSLIIIELSNGSDSLSSLRMQRKLPETPSVCGKREPELPRQVSQLIEILLPFVFSELHIHELGIAAGLDQSGIAELFDVMRERSPRDGEFFFQRHAGGLRPAGGNAPQDVIPAGVGQGFADTSERTAVHGKEESRFNDNGCRCRSIDP